MQHLAACVLTGRVSAGPPDAVERLVAAAEVAFVVCDHKQSVKITKITLQFTLTMADCL